MATSVGSLSAGLQVLSDKGLLPANLTTQQLQSATPAQLTQIEFDTVELNTVTSLFDGGTSTSGSTDFSSDLSSLLGGSTNSTSSSGATTPDQLLDAAVAASVNAARGATTSGTADSSTTTPATTSSAYPSAETLATLFNYQG